MNRRADEGMPGARRWLGMFRKMKKHPRYIAAAADDACVCHATRIISFAFL